MLQATSTVETAAHFPNKTDTTLRNVFHRWRASWLHPITWHPVVDHHVIQTLAMMDTELCVFVPTATSARAVISFTLRPLLSPVPVALRGRVTPTAGLHAAWRWISCPCWESIPTHWAYSPSPDQHANSTYPAVATMPNACFQNAHYRFNGFNGVIPLNGLNATHKYFSITLHDTMSINSSFWLIF